MSWKTYAMQNGSAFMVVYNSHSSSSVHVCTQTSIYMGNTVILLDAS